jgi:hypothetical protein
MRCAGVGTTGVVVVVLLLPTESSLEEFPSMLSLLFEL